jgi:hypothetical protein
VRALALAIAAGGSLAIAGAVLPWLTLDAGLARYGGTTGLYGWLVVAAGALAIAGGALSLRTPARWLAAASGVLGVALLAFAIWLLVGLNQFVHDNAGMMVPQAGPGLFVVIAGAAVIFVASGLIQRFFTARAN